MISTYTSMSRQSDGIDLEGLWATYRMVKAIRPVFIVCIWLVERPWVIDELSKWCYSCDDLQSLTSISGIPIIQWEWAAFDPETEVICSSPFVDRSKIYRRYDGRKIVWPWIVRKPGIWLEMADGTWRRLEESGRNEN